MESGDRHGPDWKTILFYHPLDFSVHVLFEVDHRQGKAHFLGGKYQDPRSGWLMDTP